MNAFDCLGVVTLNSLNRMRLNHNTLEPNNLKRRVSGVLNSYFTSIAGSDGLVFAELKLGVAKQGTNDTSSLS